MRNGIASIVYTLTPVDVPHNGTVRHGLINILAPNMNRGSIACITLNGSILNIDITDPTNQSLKHESGSQVVGKIFMLKKKYSVKSKLRLLVALS